MYAPERQQEILRLAQESGRVDVLSLAEEFQVTAETVRRDLKALDRAGLRIDFRQETPRPPMAAMGGAWIIGSTGPGECT
ncbi:hypothetical protein DDE05_10805, partial [Streptomyces cavourensis]